MHPTTWKASGHVDAFNDPLIDNKDSKKRYRADVLIEDYVAKLEAKIEKEVKKAAKRFGDAFDKEQFTSTNPRVLGYQEKASTILARMGKSLEKEDDWLYEISAKQPLLDFKFKEIWRYRDLLLLFVKRDIITVYKQTILGPLWFLVQPLFTSVIFTLVFNNLGSISTGGVPKSIIKLLLSQ